MLVGGATCIGEAHKRNGMPLQDSFEVLANPSGEYVIAVVSDGAGSAKHAEVGSERITSIFTKEVRRLCDESPAVSFDAFKETTSFAIQSARRSLIDDGYSLADCHATIVATLAFDDKCFLAHLGDGLQVVLIREPSGAIAACVSEPENGDASNETFFYTEDGWHNHLRLTEIPRDVLACFLMSDGMEEFVWNPKTGLKLPFCRPLLQKARDAFVSGQDLNAALNEVVSDERTNQFTNDDKTLCLVLRDAFSVTIDETGSNLNQYVIQNGQPTKFLPRTVTVATPGESEKIPQGGGANTALKGAIAKPVLPIISEPATMTEARKSRVIQGHKRSSGLYGFFWGLASFLIGLVLGYLLNEFTQNPLWGVKHGVTNSSTSVPDKNLDKSKVDSDAAGHFVSPEFGSATPPSSSSMGSWPVKDLSPADLSVAKESAPASVAKGDKGHAAQTPSQNSNATSKSSPSGSTGATGR